MIRFWSRTVFLNYGADRAEAVTGVPTVAETPSKYRSEALRVWRESYDIVKRSSSQPAGIPMAVRVSVPSALSAYIDGAGSVEVAADTVRAALDSLRDGYPRLYPNICDETGAVRRHLNIFLNNQLIRDRETLDMPLADGDELLVLAAVSGG